MQCPNPPPVAVKLLPGLGKGSPALSQGESETVKGFMALRSCLAGAVIVAINLSGPLRAMPWATGVRGQLSNAKGQPLLSWAHWGPWSVPITHLPCFILA